MHSFVSKATPGLKRSLFSGSSVLWFPTLLLLAGNAWAQDAHYWTWQYGTGANLLSGAVVGSVVDISAAYYNPGALALIDEPNLIQTSKVLELSNLSFEPDLGTDLDLNHLRFDFAPGFVAGIMPFHFLGDDVLAYSIFTRQLFKPSMDEVRSGSLSQIDTTLQGDFFGSVRFTRDLNETWVGLSWSRTPSTKLGIGISQFVAYRSQKGSSRASLQGLSDQGETLFATSEQAFSYWNVRLLWKIGVTFDWLGAGLGLTITTPSVNLFGDGRVLVNESAFAPDSTVFVADYQEGLSSTYRTPLSIALGAAYKRDATTLHFTAEWFKEVDQFSILEPDPFVGQSLGDTLRVDITQALDNVLNFGLGVEHRFKPHLSGYASFRTDFSAMIPDNTSDVSVASWDIYYITTGAAFRIGTADLTLGAAFGWGGNEVQDLNDYLDQGSPFGPETADLKYRTLRFILALAI
jgi:hypothetical protein